MMAGFAPAGARDGTTTLRLARKAEQAGFAEFWLSEDYLERGAFALAGGVAAVTENITIGLGVINPWTRHVGLTAMECGALDEVSGGRLIIGLGSSNERWMNGLLGIPFDKPIGRLLEYTSALRALLAGEHVHRDVGGLPLDAELSFRPRTGIPLHLGVKGEIALRRGARVADGFMLSVLSSPGYVAWIRERWPAPRLAGYALVSLDENRDVARDRIRPRVARFLGMHGAAPITTHAGIDQELASEFRRRMLSDEPAIELVTDAILDAVTVSGTLDDCVAAVQRFADAGLDVLMAMDDGISDPDRMLADIVQIATTAGILV